MYAQMKHEQQLPVQIFGADELPGSGRSPPQWSQKVEYCLMQCKGELKNLNAVKKEGVRKLTFIERRLDEADCHAYDVKRHVRDQPDERCQLCCAAWKKQLEKGQLCFPLTAAIFCYQYCSYELLQKEASEEIEVEMLVSPLQPQME